MNINVDIKAEDINRAVTDAIAKSAIGDLLEKAIKEQVAKLSQSYNNPLEKVIEQQVFATVRKVLQEEYADTLKNMVRDKMTNKTIDAFVEKLWEYAWKQMENN